MRGRRRVTGGATLRFTLDRAATVTLRFATKPRRGKARALGSLRLRGKKGANRVVLTGRVGRRTLAPGAYTVTLTPAGGTAAKPVRFTIRRG